jgi:two-component system cell cycle sensor histidine kinase/response regulator CckA
MGKITGSMKATEEKQLQIFGPETTASPRPPEVRSPKASRKSLAPGERLLADAAAALNAASPETFDRAVESVLQAVGVGYGAGRSGIFEASDGDPSRQPRWEWCSPAFRPEPGTGGGWPSADLHRTAENLTAAGIVYNGGHGPSAPPYLIAPLSCGECRLGFLVLQAQTGETPWGGADLERLSALAQVIGGAWERVRAEEERSLFRTAVDSAGELIAYTDQRGSIEYVNPAFERITGYKWEELVGKNPRILKSGRQNRTFYREMWKILTRGEAWHGFFVNRKKDGSLYTEEATITPLADGAGNIHHYVAVKRDMTQETSLERQLIQSQKMEAIGTLAGGIAHDFNNILSAIMGYAELALYEVSDRGRSRHDIEEVIKAGNRARDLVKQILTFSRKTEQELKPLNINPLLKEALKFLRASLPSTIDIQADIKSQAANVLCNPTQIQQVVMNLCTNAAQAMKDAGGRLTVSTVDADLKDADAGRHPDLEAAKYVRLTVSDTGPGIPPQIIGRIFDPYFTTKEQGEGTGLGLSVVHGIVQSLKGAIEVDNHPGDGVAFHIYLPQVSEPVKSETVQTRLLPTGKERILLVDDEDVLVEMGRLMLERLGYDVTVCTSGPDALETFSTRPDDFDLVFTDKTMPQLTGFDLAAEIKRIRPDTPVIITTGFSDEDEVRRAGEMGIDRLAMKPLTMDDLASIVRSVLDGRKAQEPPRH